MDKIPMYIESDMGHDTFNVPENKLAEEVTKQVQSGNWATLAKADGTSDIVTKADLTEEEEAEDEREEEEEEELDAADKELASDWKNKFTAKPEPKTVVKTTTKPSASLAKKLEKVTSVTCTGKARGG